MLSVTPRASDGAYYVERVATDSHDYYTGRGEAAGVWSGSGLESYGLTAGSEVRPEQFIDAVMARDPGTGEQLLAGRGAGNRTNTFYDLTWSAPKSVSMAYGMGSPAVREAVREAHDAAVAEGLAYLEREATVARQGKAGAGAEMATDGLIVAEFRHRTSRAGDPDLHTHATVMNLVRREDGQWRSPWSKPLFDHAKTAGMVYQAALRGELTRSLGAEWEPVSEHGQADLAAIPEGLREQFSTRRAQLRAAMAELGTSSRSAAQTAAYATREPKRGIAEPGMTAEGMHAKWRGEAAAVGLDVAEVLEGREPRDWRESAPAAEQLHTLLGGPDGLTEQATSFNRQDVIRRVARAMPDGADLATIEAAADGFLASAGVVQLHDASLTTKDVIRRQDGRIVVGGEVAARYTSADLLAWERELVAVGDGGRDAGVGVAEPAHLAAAVAARPTIGADQLEALERVTRSGATVDVVTGRAGTGKTYLLDAAREAWTASGHSVVGTAVAAAAAQGLQDETGIPSTTAYSLLNRVEQRGGFGPRTVVVVDEAGMIGTRDLHRLVALAAEDTKFVLVGDDAQLPEIDAGGAFRHLGERLGTVELVENRRLRDVDQQATAEDIRQGRPVEALARLAGGGLLVQTETAPQLHEALTANWWADRQSGAETVMIADRVADVRQLNAAARARRREAGEIGVDQLTVTMPKTRDRLGFAVGDEVMVTKNAYRHGLINSDRGAVESIDVEARTMQVRILGDGAKAGHLRVVPAELIDGGHLDHAYAQTVHKTQGGTVDRAHFLGSDASYKESAYPALTRGRDANSFYQVEPVAESVAEALGTSRAQLMASEQLGHLEEAEPVAVEAAPAPVATEREAERLVSGGALGESTTPVLDRGRETGSDREDQVHEQERQPEVREPAAVDVADGGGRRRWREALRDRLASRRGEAGSERDAEPRQGSAGEAGRGGRGDEPPAMEPERRPAEREREQVPAASAWEQEVARSRERRAVREAAREAEVAERDTGWDRAEPPAARDDLEVETAAPAASEPPGRQPPIERAPERDGAEIETEPDPWAEEVARMRARAAERQRQRERDPDRGMGMEL